MKGKLILTMLMLLCGSLVQATENQSRAQLQDSENGVSALQVAILLSKGVLVSSQQQAGCIQVKPSVLQKMKAEGLINIEESAVSAICYSPE